MSSVPKTEYAPLKLIELHPTPIAGLTRGKAAEAEAQRELIAMTYRYLRATARMRAAWMVTHANR